MTCISSARGPKQVRRNLQPPCQRGSLWLLGVCCHSFPLNLFCRTDRCAVCLLMVQYSLGTHSPCSKRRHKLPPAAAPVAHRIEAYTSTIHDTVDHERLSLRRIWPCNREQGSAD